jgi:hypothetical protein
MHKSATKCNGTLSKWCKNKHGASKIMDTLETYQGALIPRIAPSGQQCLGIIRVQALLSLELLHSSLQHLCYYSSAGFSPLNHFIHASNDLVLFECGRSCPSNISFGPAVPWYYSSVGALVPRIASFGPLAPLLLFKCGLWSLESFYSG